MQAPTSRWVSAMAVTAVIPLTVVLVVPRSARAEDLDMKKIFRCAATDTAGVEACDTARTLILNNCTVCHSFVRIVVQRYDQRGWDGLIARHRGRVSQLSDEQVAKMKSYLRDNFNPRFPPPDLPEELLNSVNGN